MHFTEPLRTRPGASVTIAGEDRHALAAGRAAATYGPSSSASAGQQRAGHANATATDPALSDSASRQTLDINSAGCVPTHRSVFRLFKRKIQLHQRSQSNVSRAEDQDEANLNASTDTHTSNSSASDNGGYLRSRKGTRAMTLSAQRTRSELAVAGPPPLAASASALASIGKSATKGVQQQAARSKNLPSAGSQPLPKQKRRRLRSSQDKKIVIPSIDDIHAADLVESNTSSSNAITKADIRRAVDSATNLASPHIDANADADIDDNENDVGVDADIEAGIADGTAASSVGNSSKHSSDAGSLRSRQRGAPRKSASASDMAKLLKEIEAEVDQHTVSEDEVLTTNPKIAVHVLPDDSSDWNSDFSSPTSWRRSADRPQSRMVARVFEGSRLKDRAIDRGVLEAQHRILQQEKYLMQISNLSSALARLRPLILRCLVFELPDRGIQIGTTTFVSAIREPCGSIEPSVEEEILWELWRQAEALLTIMDNDSMPLSTLDSRLTLSKKRAIMLAFCDWEQYSLYVQDAWDKARKGIEQPSAHSSIRRSRSSSTSSGIMAQLADDGKGRSSFESGRASSGFQSPGSNMLARFSLSRQRKFRRRSVVGVAPASLQRIADDAQRVREKCEELLMLMSPLYRESQLSSKGNSFALTSPATAAAAVIAAAETASAEIDAMEASSIAPSLSMSFSVKSCPNC
ncbi:hypothetical protein BX070DRAFT_253311 [Coemansia spiralis]|nr:hypothetical protein BX070DRAFT_253311 [Coemansia spiralis]